MTQFNHQLQSIIQHEHYDEGGRKSANYVQTSGGKGVEKFHVCAHSTNSSCRNRVFGESGLAKGGGKVPTTSEQVAGRV